MKIPHRKRGARATFEKKSQRPQKKFLHFWLFLSEVLSHRCRLSRTTSDPAQKSGKHQAKIAFFLFFRLFFWYDFVTPFSTYANIKGSLPTNSTTPDRLRCRARPSNEDFPGFWPIIFSNIAKKSQFSCRPFSPDLHPKRSP